MAATHLENIVCGDVYLDSFLREKKNSEWALWNSGLVVETPVINGASLDAVLRSKGSTFNIPFWNTLADTEPSVPKKTAAAASMARCAPDGLSQGSMTGLIHMAAHSWSYEDLLQLCLGENELDPRAVLDATTGGFWRKSYSSKVGATLAGLYNSNVANNASDMVVDLTNCDDPSLNWSNLLKVAASMGVDTNLKVVMVHKTAFFDLASPRHDRPMAITENTVTGEQVGEFLGMTVVASDDPHLVVDAATNKYRAVFATPGALAYREGRVANPESVDRDECYNGGFGSEQLFQRHAFILHPSGYDFKVNAFDAASENVSPTNAELSNAAFWDRKLNANEIGLRWAEYEVLDTASC